MSPTCYYDDNDCEKYPFDSFGGHTKAIVGFTAYNIEGAELYHMGQMTILGSYPIHYHMCLDTGKGIVLSVIMTFLVTKKIVFSISCVCFTDASKFLGEKMIDMNVLQLNKIRTTINYISTYFMFK